MPSPLRTLGRKFKRLFRSRSRDGRSTTGDQSHDPHGGGVGEVMASSSAPPSVTAGVLPPIVVVTPSLSTIDLGRGEGFDEAQNTGRSGPPAAHPSSGSGDHRTRSRRPSPGATARSSSHSATNDALHGSPDFAYDPDERRSRLSALGRQPVRSPSPAFNEARARLSPSTHRAASGPPPSPDLPSGSSSFSNAHHFTVSNLTINNNPGDSKALFEYLSPHICHGAAHDSAERCDAPKCHEETRKAVRQDVVSWIKHGDRDDEPKRIMWLSGPAGGGKTAIAGSVATACKSEGLLAASFFFSSFSPSPGRSSKDGIILTLAHHMSQNRTLHKFKSCLLTTIEGQPDIVHKNLQEQAECLILKPFRMIHQDGREDWPKVIIIDGLDEVVAAQHDDPTKRQIPRTSEDDQVEILSVLLTLSQCTPFPFQIFIASRPERNISNFFATKAQDSTINLFLDAKYEPDADVKLFLESKFTNIRCCAEISSPLWPGEHVVHRLVEMSSGQFIVPTTIIRWVEAGVPQLQLAEVLELGQLNTGTNPFATLDALYRHILNCAHNTREDPHLVLKWILCITSALSNDSYLAGLSTAKFWRLFLENVEGELSHRLGPITSLISIPPPNNITSPITIYHKSLTDFLSSPTRCGDLYVTEAACDSFIAERFFVILKNKGPIVPCPTPPDLARFLRTSFYLKVTGMESLKALASLSDSSKTELASCDVAWWTTVSLSVLYSDGTGLPHSDNVVGTKSSGKKWQHHSWVTRGIYVKIHQAMGCNSNTVSSTQPITSQALGSNCHVACIHWRTGILAKAKELGWCVHELEEVELNELQNLTLEDAGWKFSKPVPNTGSS